MFDFDCDGFCCRMPSSVNGSGTGSACQKTPSTVHGWCKRLSLLVPSSYARSRAVSLSYLNWKRGYRHRVHILSDKLRAQLSLMGRWLVTLYLFQNKWKYSKSSGSYLFCLDLYQEEGNNPGSIPVSKIETTLRWILRPCFTVSVYFDLWYMVKYLCVVCDYRAAGCCFKTVIWA